MDIEDAARRCTAYHPGEHLMEVNLRGAESPVRTKLQAFAEICPDVPAALNNCATLLRALTGPDDKIATATIAQACDLLKRMEQPSWR